VRLSTSAISGLGLGVAALAAFVATTSVGPALIAGALAASLLAIVRTRLRQPLVPVLVLAVMAGYVLFNRNFAGLSVGGGQLRVYVGELLLLLALPWAITALPSRVGPATGAVLVALGIWLAYATLRLLAGGFDYGIDAVRDFALAYYGLFVVVGYAIWPIMSPKAWIGYFTALFGALLIVVTIFATAGPFSLPLPATVLDARTAVNRADQMAVGLVAAAAFFLLPLRGARLPMVRLMAAGAALALLIPLQVRAASVSAFAMLALLALHRRWATVLTLVAMPVIGFSIISMAPAVFRGRLGETSPEALVHRQLATIGAVLGGQVTEAAAARSIWTSDLVVDTVAWRLAWWEGLLRDTTSSLPKTLFGAGFGADLIAPLDFNPDDPSAALPLRSPHNFLLTLFARTGIVGLVAWLMFFAACVYGGLRGVSAGMRSRLVAETDLLLWLVAYPVAIAVSALFGVVLEGPYSAIPCYLMLGMSLRAAQALRERVGDATVRARSAVTAREPEHMHSGPPEPVLGRAAER
jgi:hypothetical protein